MSDFKPNNFKLTDDYLNEELEEEDNELDDSINWPNESLIHQKNDKKLSLYQKFTRTIFSRAEIKDRVKSWCVCILVI